MTALGDHSDLTVLEQIYRRRKLDQGPRIVAVGGGTGSSTFFVASSTTPTTSAIVTVTDDGALGPIAAGVQHHSPRRYSQLLVPPWPTRKS
ncbi:MAG: hypothetical protein R2857_11735 [Vampirovibrionales bacterium]